MANSAYSVDFTQATRPAFEAAKDVDQMQTNDVHRQAAYQQIEASKQQQAIGAYQLDKEAKQKKWNETYVSSSTYLPNLNKFPSVKKQMDGIIKSMGVDARTVGNDIHMKNEDWKRGMETIKASAEIQKDVNDNFIRDLTAQKVQLQDPEYVKEQQKGNKDFDPKKELETINKQLDAHWQEDPKIKEAVAKEQAKQKPIEQIKAEAKAKEEGKVEGGGKTNRFKSAGSGVIFDTESGKPVYVKPYKADKAEKNKYVPYTTDDGKTVFVNENNPKDIMEAPAKLKKAATDKVEKKKANLVLDTLSKKPNLKEEDIGKALQSGAISQDEAVALAKEKGIVK